VTKVNMLSRML